MKVRKSVFQWILFLLMVLTVVEISILVFTFMGQGLIQELNKNETKAFSGRVDARTTYLEGLIVHDWMNIDSTVNQVITLTENYLRQHQLTPGQLEENADHSSALLTQITPELVTMMRQNRITGAYLILNTSAISAPDALADRPGLYLRDGDPTSLSSQTNDDLLALVSPTQVLTDLHIPSASGWDLYFRFQEEDAGLAELLYEPFRQAWDNPGRYTWTDLGYWTILHTDQGLLTYTVPLILTDGTVIGTLGMDITFHYLETLLPYQELGFEENGAYLLARYHQEAGQYSRAFGNGELRAQSLAGEDNFVLDEAYYVYSQPLRLYDTNTPFANQQWVLAGAVQTQHMQAFADDLTRDVIFAVTITLLIGVLVSFQITRLMQRPVIQISRELSAADPRKVLTLSPTGIQELDAISDAAMKLSREIAESSQMFSKIIEMSSIRMSGFRIEMRTGQMFLSEDFFSVFGEKDFDQEGMTHEAFDAKMNSYAQYIIQRDDIRGVYLMRINRAGQSRYIQLRYREADGCGYGLAEDVTQEILERQMLQHERDHDSLTGLYNRRAFRAQLQEVMKLPPEELKLGAMVMVDLDNLKFVNDSYGHEYGDQYILQAAASLERATGDRGICARISGDEFNAFLYGFDSRQELDSQIQAIQAAVNAGTIHLPDSQELAVHATGGVAWFPEHSQTIEPLLKYADYAMYIGKRSKKRSFQLFDPVMFHSPDIHLRNSVSLTRMLQYKQVYFVFQPIVDVRTGAVFAYEALMRPEVDAHFTVVDALETARRDGKLEQIEELTLFGTLETFEEHVRSGRIGEGVYLFMNSIANLVLPQAKGELFTDTYEPYLSRLVLELTEEEKINREHWELKQSFHRSFGGLIALDDYGAGYNSEKTLLEISPDFIKVDLSIIRDIHLSKDKQAIVSNIVRYAHERGKFIIAEGVETEEEVRKLVQMDVDYMQGYFFGKPHRLPGDVSEESRAALAASR